ncbi:MAG: CDP-diacylglycerol--serine O-phosphatidyltransferase [Bacteroidales bacterium]|nr:CDP-diacylglycerol--serine O-phosphatidyltransferase [Bacteroidales bacterium]
MSIKKHIPNAVTSMNLLCGTLGVIATSNGHFDWAFYLMLAAAVFDFFDGLTARALGVVSPIGKELDSLSDMVSFGVLPALMLFYWMKGAHGQADIYCFVPLTIAVFSGLRLAKFNCDERQSENFIGLATPACAMICGSLIYLASKGQGCFLNSWCDGKVFIPVMSVVLSLLLVCELPMFSMKIKKAKDLDKRQKQILAMRFAFLGVIALSAVVTLIVGLNWSFAVFISFIAYILMNVCYDIAVFRK